MSQWQLFWILLLGSTLVSFAYLFAGMVFHLAFDKRSCALRFGVMLLCPVAGPLFFLVGYL